MTELTLTQMSETQAGGFWSSFTAGACTVIGAADLYYGAAAFGLITAGPPGWTVGAVLLVGSTVCLVNTAVNH